MTNKMKIIELNLLQRTYLHFATTQCVDMLQHTKIGHEVYRTFDEGIIQYPYERYTYYVLYNTGMVLAESHEGEVR